MADIVVTLRIMPTGPEVELEPVEEKAKHLISEFGGEVGKSEFNPVAFGLKSIDLVFVMDENLGSTEKLEEDIAALENVNSAEVTDVRRAVG